MKAHLAEWISKSVIMMNEKKLENIVHCWGKTGILAIWNVYERVLLAPEAFAEVARLFPRHEKYDTSCAVNDEDNQELFEDLSSRFATAVTVNQESEEVTRKEMEEEPAIEDELIAAIISNAQSSTGDPATVGHDKAPTEQHETDGEHTNIEVDFLLISLFWQEGLEQHKRN